MQHNFFRIPAAAALLFLATNFAAQPAALTPQQAIKTRRISALTFSPDGAHLACVVSEFPSGQTPQTHIWMLDARSGEVRQFTFSPKSESAPQWSSDGRSLAFLSDRNERMQIYLMPVDGGEATALTSGKNAIGEFRWSPDGRQIAFLAPEPPTAEEEKKDKDKDDAKVADRERDLARLWVIDIASKKPRQVTHGAWRINQFEWLSSDRLLAVATNQPKAETWTNALYTISLSDGTFNRFSRPNLPFGGLSISPKKNHIAFVATRNAGPDPYDLFVQSAEGGPARDLSKTIDRRVLGVKWQNDSTAVFSTATGFRYALYSVADGEQPKRIELPYSSGDFDVNREGALAFVGIDFNRLPELFLKSPGSAPKQVSHFHQDWSAIPLANAELFRFKSFDGREVEAALMKPGAPANGTKLPLVLIVHGGPAGNFSATYSSWPQLLVAHGYEVLMVNPRGSASDGEEFLKANHADWGGGDFKDLMAGVDAVLARGETDPARLGIAGWSYGGYMAEWAITQTNRFKAAVSGAGMFDLISEFDTESGTAGDEWYFGTPWEHPELFLRSSPLTYIRHAKTPTLILQGENDTTDPLGESKGLYRALKRYGVEAELVTYPREPHGPREEKHQIDILTRMVGWFDDHLGKNSEPNE